MLNKSLLQLDETTIGPLIREARLTAGYSLRELAKQTGTSHSTISAYEHGRKSPSIPVLRKLLDECGMEPQLHCTRRIRRRDGIDRGTELEQVLALAEQFPARHDEFLSFPRFGSK